MKLFQKFRKEEDGALSGFVSMLLMIVIAITAFTAINTWLNGDDGEINKALGNVTGKLDSAFGE